MNLYWSLKGGGVKRICGVLIALVVVFSVSGQDDFGIPSLIPYELFDPCNSAPPEAGQATFNVDIIDTMNEDLSSPMPLLTKKIYISTSDMASWSNYDMTLIGTTGYENTYRYIWPVTGDFHYYYQFSTDSTISSESPKYSGTGFATASYLVNLHDDPAGDDASITVEGDTYNWTNTDLRNFKMSYSDTRLYFRMVTEGGLNTGHSYVIRECGSWITWDQYVNFYHLYAFPLINPNSPYPDSIVYAVVYGDIDISFLGVGLTIEPGVYKIVIPGSGAELSDYLDAYTKISNSTNFWHTTSGNTLSMYFDKSLLTADPDFGDFPDDDGFVTGAGIVSLALWPKACGGIPYVDIPDTFYYAVHDFSKNTAFYMRTHEDNMNENTDFTLGLVGSASWEDSLRINVLYTDADNNLPTNKQLEIGGCYPFIYDMYSYDHQYDDGASFQYTVPMSTPAKVPYRFIFSDGMDWQTTEWDTLETGISTIDVTVNNRIEASLDIGDMNVFEEYVVPLSDSFAIVNEGQVAIDLGLRVVSITDGVNSLDVADEPAVGSFSIRGILGNLYPSPSRYDDIQNRLSNIVLWCDDYHFGGGGYNLLPKCYNSELTSRIEYSDKLFLKIMSPVYASMDSDWDLTITIEVTARTHLF